jgi:hypothetical protein
MVRLSTTAPANPTKAHVADVRPRADRELDSAPANARNATPQVSEPIQPLVRTQER